MHAFCSIKPIDGKIDLVEKSLICKTERKKKYLHDFMSREILRFHSLIPVRICLFDLMLNKNRRKGKINVNHGEKEKRQARS